MLELPNKPNLKIRTVAEFMDVDIKTVKNWIKKDLLESIKIGGTVRITRESVLNRRVVNQSESISK